MILFIFVDSSILLPFTALDLANMIYTTCAVYKKLQSIFSSNKMLIHKLKKTLIPD